MKGLVFWLRVTGWTLATLAEIPMQAVRRWALHMTDIHDVFPEED